MQDESWGGRKFSSSLVSGLDHLYQAANLGLISLNLKVNYYIESEHMCGMHFKVVYGNTTV